MDYHWRRFGMAREGVTREQVFHACEQLTERGEKPTMRGVRAALGNTGSPNNIAVWTKEWREQRQTAGSEPPVAPVELPEPVRQAMAEASSRVWRAAQELAQAEIQAAKEACEQQVSTAQQERDDATGTAEDLNQQVEGLQQRIVEIESALKRKEEEVGTLRVESAALAERTRAAEEREAQLKVGLESRQKEMDRVSQSLREAEERAARLDERARTIDEQLQAERERGDRLEAHLGERAGTEPEPASHGGSARREKRPKGSPGAG
jgi:DNA repair exonuclease SbcCD ATPase subunit